MRNVILIDGEISDVDMTDLPNVSGVIFKIPNIRCVHAQSLRLNIFIDRQHYDLWYDYLYYDGKTCFLCTGDPYKHMPNRMVRYNGEPLSYPKEAIKDNAAFFNNFIFLEKLKNANIQLVLPLLTDRDAFDIEVNELFEKYFKNLSTGRDVLDIEVKCLFDKYFKN